MKRLAQVIFVLSVIGLTISCLLPVPGGGVSWEEGVTGGVLPFGLAVIVSWIFSSGLRRKDDPSGKKFGWPRIRWGWLGLWCIVVGMIVSIGAGIKASEAKSSLSWQSSSYSRRSSIDTWLYRERLWDAHGGQVLGGIITAVGVVSGIITGAQALRRRRRVRLEI
jgi:hypothetical protein